MKNTLYYGDNLDQKNGADAGVDGIAYFQTGRDDNAKIIFQIKSGGVGRGTWRNCAATWSGRTPRWRYSSHWNCPPAR